MELICLCCLAETNRMYKITSKCEFRTEDCYDNGHPPNVILLSELYSQLTQLPSPQNDLILTTNQTMSDGICARCVGLLRDFYLFRMRAIKAHGELQTKVNIAKIINHLDQSSFDSTKAVNEKCTQFDQKMDHETLNHSSDKTNSGPFICSVCKKSFRWRKLLVRHEEIHLSEKQYRCQYCDKDFLAKASRYNHELKMHKHRILDHDGHSAGKKMYLGTDTNVIRTHPDKSVKPGKDINFSCDVCDKKFTRKSSLNDHQLVQHAGIRRFSCHICSRRFGKEDSLKTHLTLHYGKSYRCKLCSKTFAKACFLRKHLEDHESPGSRRKYVCQVCRKAFAVKSHLKDHELIHSNVRPHKCDVCGNMFRQKQQLKVHSYQHFGKPFQCAECNSQYKSKSKLQAHVIKHHPKLDQIKSLSVIADDTAPESIPDFGDNAVNEEVLNEICFQMNSNPIMLENIDAGGVSLVYNDQIVFLADDSNNLLPVVQNSL